MLGSRSQVNNHFLGGEGTFLILLDDAYHRGRLAENLIFDAQGGLLGSTELLDFLEGCELNQICGCLLRLNLSEVKGSEGQVDRSLGQRVLLAAESELEALEFILWHDHGADDRLVAEDFVERLVPVALPRDAAVFETWLGGLLQGLDHLSVQIFATVLDDAAGSSPSLSSLLAKPLIATSTQTEGEDSRLFAVLARLVDHSLPVTDLSICENENSLFPSRIHGLRL